MPQDPAIIQRQIDETRAELAETIDAIADIVSPRRVAERAGEQVRAKVAELRARAGHSEEPIELAADGPAVRPAVSGAPGVPGQAPGGRTVRWGRVALAVGATTLLVVRTTRRRRHRRG
ncbi:DUF3618 domain-containing protein [Pseudofrankia asymbiotica]|uniref:DUF3618 domain-containing protein n=1 Tax=Pseudofrankia asymbiotica TaxID=1834516 RepID=A0A1V2IER4_9ACTN|nr:DUF3618 domain-containing protein [Pseudofrankia asymbiotica]ONH30946.1 hypothetical protein BL253_11245 [Pseudofrankia asymbiotica]